MSEVKRCRNCGAVISPDSIFCENCGTRVENDNVKEPRQNEPRSEQRSSRNGGNRPHRGERSDRSRGDAFVHRSQNDVNDEWEESWERRRAVKSKEPRFTPIQYVLLGLIAVLLLGLVSFGALWAIKSSSSGVQGGQTSAELQTKTGTQSGSAITILPQSEQTNPQTTAQTQEQTQKQTQETEARQSDDILNYNDYSVIIPASWKGKYGVRQSSTSCVFYQKASKEVGYNGTLFSILKYEDTSYKNLPNFRELGMGGGAAYIFCLPTDLQCPENNETVRNEYTQMTGELEWIRSNIKILVTGDGPKEVEPVQIVTESDAPQPSSDEYIFADSNNRILTETDVAGMNYDQLQMAINEIYARHGRKFTMESVQRYFDSKSWYRGTVEADAFNTSVFNSIEKANIDFLVAKMEAVK